MLLIAVTLQSTPCEMFTWNCPHTGQYGGYSKKLLRPFTEGPEGAIAAVAVSWPGGFPLLVIVLGVVGALGPQALGPREGPGPRAVHSCVTVASQLRHSCVTVASQLRHGFCNTFCIEPDQAYMCTYIQLLTNAG